MAEPNLTQHIPWSAKLRKNHECTPIHPSWQFQLQAFCGKLLTTVTINWLPREDGSMPAFEKDQLELMKRQIEEEYRLDMAAIERLQRRITGHGATGSHASHLAAAPAPLMIETPAAPLPTLESLGSQQDDITSSLRTMFSSVRK
jgi:hypothetical protein